MKEQMIQTSGGNSVAYKNDSNSEIPKCGVSAGGYKIWRKCLSNYILYMLLPHKIYLEVLTSTVFVSWIFLSSFSFFLEPIATGGKDESQEKWKEEQSHL